MAVESEVPAAPSANFPVVFFDGDSEVDIGSVPVHPSLVFKKFQAVISHRIGVAPHQISLSLVRRKKARVSPEVRRKVPIDESSDFAALARERDCFVLAVLRRSRRERRGRTRKKGRDATADEPKAYHAQAMKILRRNPAAPGVLDPGLGLPAPEAIAGGLWDYESELLRRFQRQREKYLLSVAAAEAAPYLPLAAATRAAAPAVCEECEAAKAEGRRTGFHWCVNDAVTVGFRSPVGPIERPSKKEFEASV
ncbi:hypothetical protein Cni_G24829 [Canna indica]|uniref:DUF7138 domain-containing protein n=1 Tax=Canna indica TaxID=4628 RepID=A0AAQ3KVX8_9LILI|nr:hypothetical protein Cni_G24829 [Canna indica]